MPSINAGPDTLTEQGAVPTTRMDDALKVSSRIAMFLLADRMGRSQRRSMVKGLVDGNPPYRQQDLVNAGRADQVNVNWRIAEKYLNQARSAFYDIFSETPTFATVKCEYGTAEERETIGGIVTEEFDWLQRQETRFDYHIQISQYEMILYGNGPLMFQDETDWRTESVLHRDMLVPEMARSDPEQWEECALLKDFMPHELYSYIRNEKAAAKLGWNVDIVKRAIMRAHPKSRDGGQYRTWEWHQQQLKNNSYQYQSESNVIRVAHYLFKEFPTDEHPDGAITHTIVMNPEDTMSGIGTLKYDNRKLGKVNDFLFRKENRFETWRDVIHPMYYDNDGGGYHHSVTGMGIKMYSAMAFQNRLICNQADKAFAPKILFKPMSSQANEQWSMVTWGDYGRIAPGFDMMQVPVGSWLQDGMAFNQQITNLIGNNLAQYQSNLSKENGNPITATEAQYKASEQARLGKTQLNHYYTQMDWLYDTKFKRAIKCPAGMPGGKQAEEFRKRCKDRGVTLDMLKRCCAKATRIVGQGSQFMRQNSLQQLMALSPMLNESGRNNLLSDYIASQAGQVMVERYNPKPELGQAQDDQQVIANLQIAAAHAGVPPVVSGTQNSAVFAMAFTGAASQAIQSAQQGSDLSGVFSFVKTIQPPTMQHIQKLSMDPSRKGMVQSLMKQWQQIDAEMGQIQSAIEDQQQQQQEQAQAMQQAQSIQNGTDPDIQLKAAEMQAKLGMAQQKTDAMIAMKSQKHDQGMALDDARTAAEMVRTQQLHRQKITQGNGKGG